MKSSDPPAPTTAPCAGAPSVTSAGPSLSADDGAAQADRPFVDDYLPALLGQAAQRVQGEFHRVVRAQGFAISEWRVLATLADGQAISTGQLAQVSLTKGPTATRLLDRMVARGEVERLPDPQDRRVTRVRITRQGRRTVSALINLARQHERQVLSRFGLDQAETLKSMLRELIGPTDVELVPSAAADPPPEGGRAS